MVRKYLERKLAAKADEAKLAEIEECDRIDQQEKASTDSNRQGNSDIVPTNQIKQKGDDANDVDIRRGFFAKRRNNAAEVRPQQPQRQKVSTHNKTQDCVTTSRPAFFSGLHGQTASNTKLQPRAVAIPYSRFRKERFYDWPPDPTVSRATPIILHHDMTENDDSLSASIPDLPASDDEDDDVLDSSLREHRKCTEKKSGIPEYVMF